MVFSNYKHLKKLQPDFILLCLILFSFPFRLNISNLYLISAFIYSCYLLIIKKERVNIYRFYILFPIAFFLITLTSALFSKNISVGFSSVNKDLLLILIPITLLVLTKKRINLNKLLQVFLISNIIATFILLSFNLYNFLKGVNTNQLFFHDFTRLYDQHPVYYSLNLALSCFFLNELYLKKKKVSLVVFIASSIILFLGIFFCASKIIISVFIILYTIQLLLLVKKMKFKLMFLFLFAFSIIFSANNTYIKDRFVSGFKYGFADFQPVEDVREAKTFTYDEKENISDLELRVLFAKIGLFHFWNDDKLLFGYGVGDVQTHLDYHYMFYGLAPNWYQGYNLHNQYLQVLLTFGLFVFLLFIIYLYISLQKSIKSKSIIHIYFIIIILGAFIFENYLVRNKGILFFYFFNTLFLINSSKTKKLI